MFTFASFLMLKKSLSTSSADTTIELLLVALVEVGLFEIFGVERPGPFPNIVLLRLSLGCLPESYLLIFLIYNINLNTNYSRLCNKFNTNHYDIIRSVYLVHPFLRYHFNLNRLTFKYIQKLLYIPMISQTQVGRFCSDPLNGLNQDFKLCSFIDNIRSND